MHLKDSPRKFPYITWPVLCKVRLELKQEAATEEAHWVFLEGLTEIFLRQLWERKH